MNREALPTKLNLGTMGFKHPADRSEFLKALKKSHFKWIRDELENDHRSERPPLREKYFFQGKCRKTDGNTGRGCRRRSKKICRPQYLCQLQSAEHFAQWWGGEHSGNRKKAAFRTHKWSVSLKKAVEFLPLFYWQKQFLNV